MDRWLKFDDFGSNGFGCLTFAKSEELLGDVFAVVPPLTFVLNTRYIGAMKSEVILSTCRMYFNVVKLGANPSARVKFSTDYEEDVRKWPRTPLAQEGPQKSLLTVKVCQKVIQIYTDAEEGSTVRFTQGAYQAAKQGVVARNTNEQEWEDEKEPLDDPEPLSDEEEECAQRGGGGGSAAIARRRHGSKPRVPMGSSVAESSRVLRPRPPAAVAMDRSIDTSEDGSDDGGSDDEYVPSPEDKQKGKQQANIQACIPYRGTKRVVAETSPNHPKHKQKTLAAQQKHVKLMEKKKRDSEKAWRHANFCGRKRPKNSF